MLGHSAVSQRTQAIDLPHLPSGSVCPGCSGKHGSSYRPDVLQETAAKPQHQERQSVENAGGNVQKVDAEAEREAEREKKKS